MVDGYGWNSGSPLNADNPAEEEKAHWSVRAREGLHKALDLVAEHGSTVGMAGGTALCLGAGACAIMGNAAPNELFAQEWYDSAGALTFAAMVKMGGSLVAEEAARAFLKKDDAVEAFGPERDDTFQPSPLKGAVPVEGDPTMGPRFQEAVREVLTNLEGKPDAKAALVNMLKKSPEAREAFTKQVSGAPGSTESAVNLHNAQSAENDSGVDHSEGPAPR
jgi:hypothetical protein